jgi:hypothetical protein
MRVLPAHFVVLINLLKKLRQVESPKRHVRVPCSNRPLALGLFPKQKLSESCHAKTPTAKRHDTPRTCQTPSNKKGHPLPLPLHPKESSEQIKKTARNVKKKETEREAVESQIEMGRCSKSIDASTIRFDFFFSRRFGCQWLTVDIQGGAFSSFQMRLAPDGFAWLNWSYCSCLYVTHVQWTDSG